MMESLMANDDDDHISDQEAMERHIRALMKGAMWNGNVVAFDAGEQDAVWSCLAARLKRGPR